MAALSWDTDGTRRYELGVDHVALYPKNTEGAYGNAVAWNGITSIQENPEGAEPNELWADNIKYGILYSPETLKLTIEAFTYPDEFAVCDGSAQIIAGAYAMQQPRRGFGLSYRTKVGDDSNPEAGYILHLVWGCMTQPSDRDHETVNDSPDAMTLSWEVDTTPEVYEVIASDPSENKVRSTSCIEIDSTKVDSDKLAAVEALLNDTSKSFPSVDLVIATLEGRTISQQADG